MHTTCDNIFFKDDRMKPNNLFGGARAKENHGTMASMYELGR